MKVIIGDLAYDSQFPMFLKEEPVMFAFNNSVPQIVRRFREIFRGAYRGCVVDISKNIFKRNRVNVELFFDGGSIVIHSSAATAKWAIKNALEAFRGNTVGIEASNGEYAFHVGERLQPGETRTVTMAGEAKEKLAKLRLCAALREIHAAI